MPELPVTNNIAILEDSTVVEEYGIASIMVVLVSIPGEGALVLRITYAIDGSYKPSEGGQNEPLYVEITNGIATFWKGVMDMDKPLHDHMLAHPNEARRFGAYLISVVGRKMTKATKEDYEAFVNLQSTDQASPTLTGGMVH